MSALLTVQFDRHMHVAMYSMADREFWVVAPNLLMLSNSGYGDRRLSVAAASASQRTWNADSTGCRTLGCKRTPRQRRRRQCDQDFVGIRTGRRSQSFADRHSTFMQIL